MWLLYAVAFLLGAGILLIQLLSGHHGHDAALPADIGHDGGGHHAAHGPGLMSLRAASYGVFTFGFVGGTLHVLGLTSPTAALAIALVAGVAVMLAVGFTFQRLGDPTVSGEAGLHEARGATGRVLVGCARGREGKVRVTLKGQTVDMLATTDEDDIPAGAEVVVTDVQDMVARVARAAARERRA
jgi:membrane protein implicated in regulation of membrane protease activity